MSKGIWGLLLGLTSAWVAVSADAAKDAQHAVERIERGNLVLEDVPPVPDEIADRTYRYQQARSAVLAGWLGRAEDGLLISTRFGDTAQVHRVAMWRTLAHTGAYVKRLRRSSAKPLRQLSSARLRYHWRDGKASRRDRCRA